MYLAAVVIMVAGVVATKSRGGFLGLVAVIAYCFIFSPRKKLGLAIGAVLVLVGLMVVPDSYWEEMATISRDAESDVGTGAHRKKLWGVAIDMFLANPIFGVGLNNFPWNVGNYMSAELLEKEGRSYTGTAAHSVYFTILSETGAAGVLVIASITYFSVRSVRRLLAQTRKMEAATTLRDDARMKILEMKGIAYGLGGGMIGYGVSGIFLTAFVYPHFWYVVALIVAVATVTDRMAADTIPLQPPKPRTIQSSCRRVL
jgi:O-antigen ligase